MDVLNTIQQIINSDFNILYNLEEHLKQVKPCLIENRKGSNKRKQRVRKKEGQSKFSKLNES